MKYYYTKSLEKILSTIGNRRLILYKADSMCEIIYKNLVHMGLDVEYFISEDDCGSIFWGKEVKSVYDLLHEDRQQIYVIVFALAGHGNIYESLIGVGFEFEKDFCIYGLGGYNRKFDAIDSLLGFNRCYEGMWGFKVYGEESTAEVKIMTLGGSTSDPTIGNYKSWPEFLYEKISEKYHCVLYSGGMGGYSVNQEFLKFIRDGLHLQPDILITYDGYNEAAHVSTEGYPFLHAYQNKFYAYLQNGEPVGPSTLDMRNPDKIVHGLTSRLSMADNWAVTVRTIHAVAEEFHIRYYSFFQPMILSGKAIIDESVVFLSEQFFEQNLMYKKVYHEIPNFVKECQREISGRTYITDLTTVFDGEEDVYYDICHATDKGNRIIMENVYEKIKDALEEVTR